MFTAIQILLLAFVIFAISRVYLRLKENGVGRGVDIIVYISLALLFYLVFRIYVMIEDLRHQITYIIREIALSGSSKIRKNHKKPKK